MGGVPCSSCGSSRTWCKAACCWDGCLRGREIRRDQRRANGLADARTHQPGRVRRRPARHPLRVECHRNSGRRHTDSSRKAATDRLGRDPPRQLVEQDDLRLHGGQNACERHGLSDERADRDVPLRDSERSSGFVQSSDLRRRSGLGQCGTKRVGADRRLVLHPPRSSHPRRQPSGQILNRGRRPAAPPSERAPPRDRPRPFNGASHRSTGRGPRPTTVGELPTPRHLADRPLATHVGGHGYRRPSRRESDPRSLWRRVPPDSTLWNVAARGGTSLHRTRRA